MKRALLLLALLLSSCGSLHYNETTKAWFCVICAAFERTMNSKQEKGPDVPGLNSKSTQDFSDPEKDGAPQKNADKNQPVRP
jgi:hypothetical protein